MSKTDASPYPVEVVREAMARARRRFDTEEKAGQLYRSVSVNNVTMANTVPRPATGQLSQSAPVHAFPADSDAFHANADPAPAELLPMGLVYSTSPLSSSAASSSTQPGSSNLVSPSSSPSRLSSSTLSSGSVPSVSGDYLDTQRCPHETDDNYCRDWNLKFLCTKHGKHLYRGGLQHELDAKASATLTQLTPDSGIYQVVTTNFMSSWKYIGARPVITKIERVRCPKLEGYFKMAQAKLCEKNPMYYTSQALYHGTCEANFDKLFEHGLQPPADYEASAHCKHYGNLAGKISTSLCLKTCLDCAGENAVRHRWNKCHMFGLGVYFADQSSKADIYVSDAAGNVKGQKNKKMLVVDVLLGDAFEITKLKSRDEFHDIVTAPDSKDSIMAVGTNSNYSSELAVMNNEFVIFNPKQTLPRYVITYDIANSS